MIFIFNSDVEYITICSSRKYPYPPPPHGGQQKFRGEGAPEGGNFWGDGGGGLLLEVFFPGAQGNIVKLSKPNSCSVEQAISYFAANDLLNKNYCFHQWSFIYRLLSNVFFTSCMINSCHQLMNKLLVIYSCTCCCITQYFVVFIVMWSCSKPSSNIILTERKK